MIKKNYYKIYFYMYRKAKHKYLTQIFKLTSYSRKGINMPKNQDTHTQLYSKKNFSVQALLGF